MANKKSKQLQNAGGSPHGKKAAKQKQKQRQQQQQQEPPTQQRLEEEGGDVSWTPELQDAPPAVATDDGDNSSASGWTPPASGSLPNSPSSRGRHTMHPVHSPAAFPHLRSFSLERGLSASSHASLDSLDSTHCQRQPNRAQGEAGKTRAASLDSGRCRREEGQAACATPTSPSPTPHDANDGVAALTEAEVESLLQRPAARKRLGVAGEARYNNGITTGLSGTSASGTTPNATAAGPGPVSPLTLLQQTEQGVYILRQLPLCTDTALQGSTFGGKALPPALAALHTVQHHSNPRVPGHVLGQSAIPQAAHPALKERAQHARYLQQRSATRCASSSAGNNSNSSDSGTAEGLGSTYLNPHAVEWSPGRQHGAGKHIAPLSPPSSPSPSPPSPDLHDAPPPPLAPIARRPFVSLEEWSGCSATTVNVLTRGQQHNTHQRRKHPLPWAPPTAVAPHHSLHHAAPAWR